MDEFAKAPHIHLDPCGIPWLDDTNIKVIEVVMEQMAHGSTPEEIHEQHQDYLTLAQIHAALTWYYDHQAEMDAEIQRQVQDFDKLRAQNLDSPGRQKLRSLGKLP